MNFDEYERREWAKYKAFAEAVATILHAAIRATDPAYRLQQIQKREKGPASLKKKLAKCKVSEGAAIEDKVKDLAACRVIFYTNADVTRFVSSDILRGNFKIDWDRTKFHRPVPGTESEGRLFISDNYVVQLNDERAAAAEYAQFRGLRCEIQVQTTLNHAWSEMEHDVYKDEPADGFGKSLLAGIKTRFKKVMQEMLVPAGHEFQKIVDDYNNLVSGRELFDQGSLRRLPECAENNERHDLLEKFKTYVLPHLDDPAGAHTEIRNALVTAVLAARDTDTKPIVTPWGELDGKTEEDVLDQAANIFDDLRYVSIDAPVATLDALCELYPTAETEAERQRILRSVKSLAANNYDVWKAGGPVIQDMLVRRILEWDSATLEALRPIALTALEEFLKPEATGTSATYKAITITTAEVTPSEALAQIRTMSLNLLEELFRSATDDVERREAKQILLNATRFPQRGAASALRLTILDNSARVVRFFGDVSETLSFELLQTLEERLLWLYRHTRRAADAPAEEPATAAARQALIEAIFAFRDRINANRDFVVYKTLVGFESVFPPEWEGDPMEIQAEEDYRNARISELVADVSEANADAWLKIMQRCASTRSNDLATFPPFGRFIDELARTKPAIAASYLDRLGEDLSGHIPGFLRGLEATDQWAATKQKIDGWVTDHRYLSQILWHQRWTDRSDVALIKRALDFAIEDGNDRAVMNAAEICAARSEVLPREEIRDIFATAIGYFKAKNDSRWANAIWANLVKSSLVEALTEEQIDLMVSALVPLRSVNYHAEYVLSAIAKRYPEKVIDFFGARLRHREEDEKADRYESVPYSLATLGKHLSKMGAYLLGKSHAWHRENPEFFEFRGGRLLSIIFPEFSPEIERLLKDLLASGQEGVPRFAADLMRAYRGSPATHEILKLIVDAVPEGDRTLTSVAVALQSTGVVSGEFGMREAYQRKKAELQPWLTDARPRVKAFAELLDRDLDRMIAAEQRRSEDDLEARKRRYGEGNDPEGGN